MKRQAHIKWFVFLVLVSFLPFQNCGQKLTSISSQSSNNNSLDPNDENGDTDVAAKADVRSIGEPRSLVLSADGRSLYYSDMLYGQIGKIDLTNNKMSVISSATHGAGDPIPYVCSMSLSYDQSTLAVASCDNKVILVDVVTGDRKTISLPSDLSSVPIVKAELVSYVSSTKLYIVYSTYTMTTYETLSANGLWEYDLLTGVQTNIVPSSATIIRGVASTLGENKVLLLRDNEGPSFIDMTKKAPPVLATGFVAPLNHDVKIWRERAYYDFSSQKLYTHLSSSEAVATDPGMMKHYVQIVYDLKNKTSAVQNYSQLTLPGKAVAVQFLSSSYGHGVAYDPLLQKKYIARDTYIEAYDFIENVKQASFGYERPIGFEEYAYLRTLTTSPDGSQVYLSSPNNSQIYVIDEQDNYKSVKMLTNNSPVFKKGDYCYGLKVSASGQTIAQACYRYIKTTDTSGKIITTTTFYVAKTDAATGATSSLYSGSLVTGQGVYVGAVSEALNKVFLVSYMSSQDSVSNKTLYQNTLLEIDMTTGAVKTILTPAQLAGTSVTVLMEKTSDSMMYFYNVASTKIIPLNLETKTLSAQDSINVREACGVVTADFKDCYAVSTEWNNKAIDKSLDLINILTGKVQRLSSFTWSKTSQVGTGHFLHTSSYGARLIYVNESEGYAIVATGGTTTTSVYRVSLETGHRQVIF